MLGARATLHPKYTYKGAAFFTVWTERLSNKYVFFVVVRTAIHEKKNLW